MDGLTNSYPASQAASRSLGSILIFAVFLVLVALGYHDVWVVPLIASFFPLCGLLGVLVAPESPIFLERKNALEAVEEGGNDGWRRRIEAAKKLLNVPLRSPEVYQLILGITG